MREAIVVGASSVALEKSLWQAVAPSWTGGRVMPAAARAEVATAGPPGPQSRYTTAGRGPRAVASLFTRQYLTPAGAGGPLSKKGVNAGQ
jgi:hypothetical protein